MSDKDRSAAIDTFKACVAALFGYLCLNLSTYLVVTPLISYLTGQGELSRNTVLVIDLLCNFLAYSLAVFLACLFTGRLIIFTGIAIGVLSAGTYNSLIAIPDIQAGNYRLWYILAVNFTIASGSMMAIWAAKRSLNGLGEKGSLIEASHSK